MNRAAELVEKGRAFSDNFLQSAAAHSLSAKADNSHVCGLRSVFADAHVAGKNNPIYLLLREQTL